MWRAVASNGFTLLIVAAFLLAGLILWGKSEYTAEGPLEAAICVRVPSGANMTRVSDNLQDQGAVRSAAIMRIGADYTDKSDELKAGAFLVPERSSVEEIVDIVTRGGASTCGTEILYRIGVNSADVVVRELDPATSRFVEKAKFVPQEDTAAPEEFTRVRDLADTRYRVTMAEGVTSWQVVDALSRIDVLDGDVAERPAEGSLAPDSYEVAEGDSRQSVIDRMRDAQSERLREAWVNRAPDLPISSPEEALILASIIEKETGVPEERGQVASVFTNRLREGMRLQTDPTVIYGITNGEGVLGRGLRRSELDRETPYNTYVIAGLPPTPIANPGRASIAAAVNPGDSDFLFFVADGSGGHAFARTLEEHNSNVAQWRKIEAERANQ
ncbi:endolytic transglycosylase MltG [Pseudooceanicola aestuarii]|uniref:endolytic transglycosylase MltG n=1 Tax=Pseudooceanicola aestuarii TaxID=2697319 RepID=UPI0013D68926|nr:endolytic transglycosylase MltG [Pseudooceanicola aestuarii]